MAMDVSTTDSDSASVSAVLDSMSPAPADGTTIENLVVTNVSQETVSEPVQQSARDLVSEPVSLSVTVPEQSGSLIAPVTVPAGSPNSAAAVESQAFFVAPKPRRDERSSRSSSRQRARSVGRSPPSDRGLPRPDRSPSPVGRSPDASRPTRPGRQASQQRASRRDLADERRSSQAPGSGRQPVDQQQQRRASPRRQLPAEINVADQKRDVAVRHLRTVLSQPGAGDDSGQPTDTVSAVLTPQLPTKRKAEDTHQRRVCPSATERVPASSPDVEMSVVGPMSVDSSGTDSGTAPPPHPPPAAPQDWAADVEASDAT
ncbi:uncharacterized protein LOC126273300 [Schistocerca gregaria]|uniref:uncharacterized protein LOC126273300 n=1 Tax=Schistocerca gregaria TaxID=7010 RepID=UPI00211E1664|nr:uncharacterized protein LOC126273300 [Schistocerca gregaria]